jgi:hypothetical protein
MHLVEIRLRKASVCPVSGAVLWLEDMSLDLKNSRPITFLIFTDILVYFYTKIKYKSREGGLDFAANCLK